MLDAGYKKTSFSTAEKTQGRSIAAKFANRAKTFVMFITEDLNKMVYLHSALYEILRSFPPVPSLNRTAIKQDILPSGHHINEKTQIMISAYAMGRMVSVWGDDCHEFKPKRWTNEDGHIRHVASHKFFALSAGPGVCLGKEVAFTLLKNFVAAIIHNYNVEVIEGQTVIAKPALFCN